MKRQIDAWLKNPSDYALGLSLYNATKISLKHDKFLAGNHPKSSMQHKLLMSLLTRVSSKLMMNPEQNVIMVNQQVNTNKNETKKMVRANPLVEIKLETDLPVVIPETQRTTPIFVYNDLIDVTKLPADLQNVYFAIKDKYKEMTRIHELLTSPSASNDERKTYLEKLVKADNEVRAWWDVLDTYAKNPSVNISKEASKPPKPDTARKLKHLENLKDYIRRESKNLEKQNISDKSKSKKQARIKAWEKQVEELKTELGV